MRLLILVAVAALLPTASVAGPASGFESARRAVGPECPAPPGFQHVVDPGSPLMPRKLNELPPADAYQAVLRSDAKGCLDPLLVNDRIRQSQRSSR